MTKQKTFGILCITARSDHPVRNPAGELIFGNHVLWEDDNVNDGDKGSLAPNVFSYDFKSPLASNSSLDIAIKVVGVQLSGSEYRLSGALHGSKVFESDTFPLRSREVTVTARVVKPHNSPNPLAFNGDFTWTLKPKHSDHKLDCANKTRLELYWISANIHEIFLSGLSGIQVDFLRYAFLKASTGSKPDICGPQPPTIALTLPWNQVTQQVFSNYSKVYDTVSGAPHFGVTNTGGHFNYSYYIQPATAGGAPGSLYRIVNCYDQAAMVQVLASLGVPPFPNWLYMNPYGYINTTSLVGVNTPCNNPFFQSNNTPPLIGVNDTKRTGFGNHAFNGLLHPFNPQNPNERIFDACGGPQLGTLNPFAYVNAAIDTTTNLYTVNGWQPGTVASITGYPGVTSFATAHPRVKNSEMTAKMGDFIQRCAVNNAKPYSQIRWDAVATWAKSVLGAQCEVAFTDTVIGNGTSETLWHLTGVDGIDGDVTVRVRAETHVGDDGDLDVEKSSEAAFDNFAFTLKDIELDLGPDDEGLSNLYAPAPFDDFAHYALQYASHIPEGRFLIASGNHMITISGGSSSAALEPVVRKLLAHTTMETRLSRHVPKVPEWSYEIPEASDGSLNESVGGVGTSFDIRCQVDDVVGAASADVEGHGLLLNKYRIETDEADNTSTVTFTFVTRVVGTHNVDLRFTQASTMTASSKRIQVTVVEA